MLITSSVVDNLPPYLYKLLLDTVTNNKLDRVIKYLLLFIGIRVAGNLINALANFLSDRVYIPSSRDARIAVFKKIQDLDFAYHANKNTGSLISIFKRGDNAFGNLFDDTNNIVKIIVTLFIALIFFSRISSVIVIIMFSVFFGNFFLSIFLIKNNMKKRKAFNDSEDMISGDITDNLINYETVKFFSKEEKEENRLRKDFIPWTVNHWGYANSFRLMDVCVGSLSNLGMLLILWITVSKLINHQIGIGDFVLIVSFTTGFYYRFFEMLYRFRNVAKNYVDIQNYISILGLKPTVTDPVDEPVIDDIIGKIEFKNVTFTYSDPKSKVLKDLSIEIQPGQSVAFVGRSGAGKTTIIKALLRFYDVQKGSIMIDGIDIRYFTKSRLRSFMGVVPQEPILFNNSIGFNIAYGKDNATAKEIINAARMANLHEFIDCLPLKYETPVGERGIKLSGGQKQRLAIARMLLSDPKIIIFDEATSNLDSESEKLIQNALWKVAKGRTVLIIAHRFSTVRRADRIIVLDNGSMVQEGSHQQLIEDKNGLYYYLWSLQTKGIEDLDEEDTFLES